MHGQSAAEVGALPEKLVYNSESDKPRVREFQRFQPGPAAVHKVWTALSLTFNSIID